MEHTFNGYDLDSFLQSLPVIAQQRIAVALGKEPSSLNIHCEFCGTVKPLGLMNSFLVSYAMPGSPITPSYGCPVEQHYGCSHEHALLATIRCMLTCLEEGEHTGKKDSYEHPLLQHIKHELVERKEKAE